MTQSNPRSFVFSSESVTEGHPDKIADAISDAVLDAALANDRYSRVACETLITTGMVVLAGEITTSQRLDYTQLVRDTVNRIGYDDASYGFDGHSCAVLVALDKQSPDIAQGVDRALEGRSGDCERRVRPIRRRRPGNDVRLRQRRDSRVDADANRAGTPTFPPTGYCA